MSAGCQHSDRITDHQYACLVCTSCGLVLEENLSYDEIHLRNPQVFPTSEDCDEKILEYIFHICDKMNVYKIYGWCVFEEYGKVLEKCKKFQKTDIVSFCLYQVLKKKNVGRSMREVSFYTFTPEKILWKIESTLKSEPNPLDPVNVLECHYTKFRHFSYKDFVTMKKMLNLLPYNDHTPMSKAAGIMFCFVKLKKLKITMKNISDIFGICTATLSRFHKKHFSTVLQLYSM